MSFFIRKFSELLAKPQRSPAIKELAAKISQLTLLETSQLVSELKETLQISDIAPVSAFAAPKAAPVSEQAEVVTQTHFKVTLVKFDAEAKAKIIREIKAQMPSLNLVQAKQFVESVPKTIEEKLLKKDADAIKEKFEALGATIALE